MCVLCAVYAVCAVQGGRLPSLPVGSGHELNTGLGLNGSAGMDSAKHCSGECIYIYIYTGEKIMKKGSACSSILWQGSWDWLVALNQGGLDNVVC